MSEIQADGLSIPDQNPTEAARNPQTGEIQKPTQGAYQQNGQSWLGGPQNGNETPGKAEKTLQEKPSSDISGPTGSGK